MTMIEAASEPFFVVPAARDQVSHYLSSGGTDILAE